MGWGLKMWNWSAGLGECGTMQLANGTLAELARASAREKSLTTKREQHTDIFLEDDSGLAALGLSYSILRFGGGGSGARLRVADCMGSPLANGDQHALVIRRRLVLRLD